MVDPVRVLNGCVKFYQSLIFHCRDKWENVIFRPESSAAKKMRPYAIVKKTALLKFKVSFAI